MPLSVTWAIVYMYMMYKSKEHIFHIEVKNILQRYVELISKSSVS